MKEIEFIASYLKKKIPLHSPCCFVGGTVRDELLSRPYNDFDLASPYKAEELLPYLKEEKKLQTYAMKYGALSFKINDNNVTITTYREERNYIDHRHPTDIVFIKDYRLDALRRDFTINAIYMDLDLRILDPLKGEEDLKSKVIRMIGDPSKRIKEDPLRILRAYRFKEELGFTLEPSLEEFINNNLFLLKGLRLEKIKQELAKFPSSKRALYEEKVRSVLE